MNYYDYDDEYMDARAFSAEEADMDMDYIDFDEYLDKLIFPAEADMDTDYLDYDEYMDELALFADEADADYFDTGDEYMDEQDLFPEEADYDTCLDGLLAFLASMPQETVKMVDLFRYRLLLETAAKLGDLLAYAGETERIDVEVNQLFNLGSVRVELDDLTVTDPKAFAELVTPADNFEVYALTDGRVRLSISFQNVLKTMA